MSEMGHNSGVAGDRLKEFIERVERLEEEKAALTSDVRDVYAEAKSAGFDPKIMRIVVRERRQTEQERRERDELIELYMGAMGLLD